MPGTHRFRWFFIVVEGLVAVGAVGGAVQLITGTAVPPIDDLEPLGLTSWVLPGVWLFASVAVPSTVAAWLAWQRSSHAPIAVLVASTLLAVELLVQIPFVGPSMLQVVLGTVAIALAPAPATALALPASQMLNSISGSPGMWSALKAEMVSVISLPFPATCA